MIQIQQDLPGGYDAADALADGWTADALAAAVRWRPFEGSPPKPPETPQRPAPRGGSAPPEGTADDPTIPADDELPSNFACRKDLGGIVYLRAQAEARSEIEKVPPPLWVCPLFRIVAVTRNECSDDFGRLLVWRDLDSRERRDVIYDRELQGSADAVRSRLAAAGFSVSNHPEARRQFSELLRRWKPQRRARAVTRTGWTNNGKAFVLPERVLGCNGESVILAADGDRPAFAVGGSLAGWRDGVATLCIGNSRLVFAVAVAFAAPCLDLIDAESGGFHLVGSSVNASSSGKTTTQLVAASVCGPPRQYLRRWRATDNALENLAELHNDTPLFVDELNQMDPKTVGEAVHMLGNGTGKVRMERNAGSRPVKSWRVLFVSSGEIGLSEHMASVARKVRAGQEVRMAEIPADAGAGFGVFETLHGYPDGAAFAIALKESAMANYGYPFIAFVEALIRNRNKIAAEIKRHQAAFVVDALAGMDAPSGQVRRVAARFGLVAVAGELASLEGITGWPAGAAQAAAKRCFGDWLSTRGGAGPAEERELLAQVRLFFERHTNRFRSKARALDDHAPDVPMMAGYKEVEPKSGGLVCYTLPETFRQEVISGFNERDACRVLIRHGLLKPGTDGRNSQKVRLPGRPTPQRCYVFHLDAVAADGP